MARTSKTTLDLDLLNRMKRCLHTTDTIYQYKIMPFYSDKRRTLIKNIVTQFSDDTETIDNTVQLLADSITAQKRFFILEPDFIIQYVEYFCKNIGEVNSNSSGVFSKVFEANIINSVSKHQTKQLSVDKIFVLLSKIAY